MGSSSKPLLRYHGRENNVDAYENDNRNLLMLVPIYIILNLNVYDIHAIIL